MKTSSAVLAATFIATALSIASCAQTTADRGLTYGSPDRNERLGLSEKRIEVILLRDNGLSVPNVKITAESSHSTDSGTTNSDGTAVITASLADSDGLDFHFEREQPKIKWTKSFLTLPPQQNNIRILFKIDRQGRIRMAEMEY